MPSLILHIDETLENIFEISAVKAIEKSIIDIIQEELEAEKNNCQIIWVKSKIICSSIFVWNYSLKARQIGIFAKTKSNYLLQKKLIEGMPQLKNSNILGDVYKYKINK